MKHKTVRYNSISKNYTKKHVSKTIMQGSSISSLHQGWIHITIKGEPFERGFQHGYLLRSHFKNIHKVLSFIVKHDFCKTLTEYMKTCKNLITPNIKKYHPEFLEELHGISKGAKISMDFLIAWNSILSMYSYYDYINARTPDREMNIGVRILSADNKNESARCSAFIACGNATKDGKIVMAHNTHSDYATGPLANIVLRVIPAKGHSFVMQTYPGYIASATDWFLCDTGIIGCETTISHTNYKPRFGTPYFCRIREAMQYGETLDEYVEIMLKHNAGDYACSWLFGDIKQNKIMLFEIGLNKNNIQTTTNGIYYGMNSAIDFELRSVETSDKAFDDLSESSGARNARMNMLLNNKYYGKIDIESSKTIISDHYDSHLNKIIPTSLTVCKHTDLDPGAKRPFYPYGCVDGKITNSDMAQNMEFFGRQGASCGKPFLVKKYFKEHPEYAIWKPVLVDMPTYEWTKL